ncbi:MAG: hypothetical protein HYZ53_30570 [Planctomycetes bacterium]|nr:hypothetical protein [Planctomycetota bacterium]
MGIESGKHLWHSRRVVRSRPPLRRSSVPALLLGLAPALLLLSALGPVTPAFADHGDPSTRESGMGALFDPKPDFATATQAIADHDVTLTWYPQALAPRGLARLGLVIRPKGSSEAYTGEVKFSVRPKGGAAEALVLPLVSAGEASSALHVFTSPGAFEATVEFTPIPAPGAASGRITKQTVVFPLQVGATSRDPLPAILGGVALLSIVLLVLAGRKKA